MKSKKTLLLPIFLLMACSGPETDDEQLPDSGFTTPDGSEMLGDSDSPTFNLKARDPEPEDLGFCAGETPSCDPSLACWLEKAHAGEFGIDPCVSECYAEQLDCMAEHWHLGCGYEVDCKSLATECILEECTI